MNENESGGFIRNARDARQFVGSLIGFSSLLAGSLAIIAYRTDDNDDCREVSVFMEEGLEGVVHSQQGIFYQEVGGELRKAWYFVDDKKVEVTSESRVWPYYLEDFEKIRENERRIAAK